MTRPLPAFPPRCRACRGITLVELMVVLVIIIILNGIMFTVAFRARASAQRAVCVHNLHQLVAGLKMFEQSHGHLPGSIEELSGTDALAGQSPFASISRCPLGGPYEYFPNPDEESILLVCRNHLRMLGTVVVARHDGAVRSIPQGLYQGP